MLTQSTRTQTYWLVDPRNGKLNYVWNGNIVIIKTNLIKTRDYYSIIRIRVIVALNGVDEINTTCFTPLL